MLTDDEMRALVAALRLGKAARRKGEPTEDEIRVVVAWGDRARTRPEVDPAFRTYTRYRTMDFLLQEILDGKVVIDVRDGEPFFTFKKAIPDLLEGLEEEGGARLKD